MEQSSISRRRQQSVQHSGVREALLAPMVAPALPDAGRSSSSTTLKTKVGGPTTEGQPYLFPSKIKIQHSSIDNYSSDHAVSAHLIFH